MDDYCTISQTAKRISLPEHEIRRRVIDGYIKGEKVGTLWIIPESEVKRLATEYPLSEPSIAS